MTSGEQQWRNQEIQQRLNCLISLLWRRMWVCPLKDAAPQLGYSHRVPDVWPMEGQCQKWLLLDRCRIAGAGQEVVRACVPLIKWCGGGDVGRCWWRRSICRLDKVWRGEEEKAVSPLPGAEHLVRHILFRQHQTILSAHAICFLPKHPLAWHYSSITR